MVSFKALAAFSALSVVAVFAAPVPRALPTPVSASTARTYLNELTIAAESNSPAYDRDLFHTWITIEGTCNTRESHLKAITRITVNSDCTAASGRWVSPYDNVATTLASDLDIDHVVPLKEAWVSGARSWTSAQREAFANDVTRPQLAAVTDNLNQSKGDKDPAEWMVPLSSFVCTYVRAWVTVKHFYSLTVDQAEYNALSSYLADC
ncbi:hypothetical protein CPB85DRAFT_1305940 [Mucidula mucida]|nr:hypothetical protein CPB85DRAFT_1305940 [Mucidula mucida]